MQRNILLRKRFKNAVFDQKDLQCKNLCFIRKSKVQEVEIKLQLHYILYKYLTVISSTYACKL